MSMPANNQQERLSFVFFVVVLLLAVALTLYMIAPYFVALGMGGIMSLLARPLHARLRKRGLGPTVSATIVTLGVVLVVVGPLLVFGGVAVRQAVAFGSFVSKIDPAQMRDTISGLIDRVPSEVLREHLHDLQLQAGESVKDVGSAIAASMVEVAKGIPSGILNIFLACLACFFFLVDGSRFNQWLQTKIPLDHDVRDKLAESFKDTAISTVWASMAAAGTQALIMGIAYAVLRVPGAPLAAGATFIFAWIPILGCTPVFLVGAAILFFQGSPIKVGLMIVFGLIAGIVDNFVRPLVLKGRGEMHPLVSLIAIFGGIHMFGFFGVFFGPIIAAVVITLLQVWPIVGRRWGLRVGSTEPIVPAQ